MLQETNGLLLETNGMIQEACSITENSIAGSCIPYGTGNYPYTWPYQTIYWQSYPVYVCTDKTKKAIDILKALQAEKLLECKSVPRFIELVDKIAGLL